MKRILVTGANGFVGTTLCRYLRNAGYIVRGTVRRSRGDDRSIMPDIVDVGEIGPFTDWSSALDGVDTVVHLAARVHVMQELSENPLEAFRMVNVRGTERLARMAIKHGVKRFVYVSSISVHGNSTGEKAYTENDEANPHSPYAISKWEGELALRQIARESDLEIVVIRPPLVYGPGVGGNFLRLVSWADKGLPLPLGSVRNKRSFIGIENLADLLVACVSNQNVAGETFVAADGEDLSTPDLIRRIATLLGRPAKIVPFPVPIMRAVSKVLRKDDILDRLCNSLRVDPTKARQMLGWRPRVSLDEGLERTSRWYISEHRNTAIK